MSFKKKIIIFFIVVFILTSLGIFIYNIIDIAKKTEYDEKRGVEIFRDFYQNEILPNAKYYKISTIETQHIQKILEKPLGCTVGPSDIVYEIIKPPRPREHVIYGNADQLKKYNIVYVIGGNTMLFNFSGVVDVKSEKVIYISTEFKL